MKWILKYLIYLIPFSLIIGTNFEFSRISSRSFAIGHTELLILIISLLTISKISKSNFPKNLCISYFIYTIAIFVSIIASSAKSSGVAIIELIRWLEYFILFVIVYLNINSREEINTIYKISIIPILYFIYVSIEQSLTFNFYEKRIYGTFVSAANINGESVSNPNVAGAFLTGCFLVFFVNYIKQKKIYTFILLIILFLLTLLTLSRSAFIGLIIGQFVIFYLFNKNILYKLIEIFTYSLIIILISYYFFPAVFDDLIILNRFLDSFDNQTVSGESIFGRIENSKKIIRIALDNLFLGVGFGDLENQFNLIPDNYYIHNFAETGIIGSFFSTIFLIVIFRDLIRFYKYKIDSSFKYRTIAIISIYCSFLIENYSANLFRNPRMLGLFWLLIALIYKEYSLLKSSKFKDDIFLSKI